MRRSEFVWFAFLAAVLPVSPLAIDSRAADEAQERITNVVLPSETCRGFFILPVTVRGTTLSLLFDTGSSWTFVDPAGVGFGPAEFENPVTFLADGVRLVFWQVLRHFAVSFDQREKRIRIERRSGTGAIPTSAFVSRGFATRVRPQGLEIVRVFAGTPAAAVGLRDGDIVRGIDGTPVYERHCEQPYADPAGVGVHLSVLRDEVPVAVEIKTVALLP